MSIAPCKDCPRRKVGCHATCEDYALWKCEHNAIMEEVKRNKCKAGQDFASDATTKKRYR